MGNLGMEKLGKRMTDYSRKEIMVMIDIYGPLVFKGRNRGSAVDARLARLLA